MTSTRRIFVPAASDWRWPFTWYVRPGDSPPYESWLLWHYHALLPRTIA